MPDTADLVPLIEEMISQQREISQQQREMSQNLTHVGAKVDNMNDKLDTLAVTVDEHERIIHRGDGNDGGLAGRIGRVEDRVSARIDNEMAKVRGEIRDVKEASEKRDAVIDSKVTPMLWVGGVFALVFVGWAANGVLAALLSAIVK